MANTKIVSPVSTLDYPYLTTADEGNGKFAMEPKFHTKFSFANDAAGAAFFAAVERDAEASYQAAFTAAANAAKESGKPARRVKRADMPIYATEGGFTGKASLKRDGFNKKENKAFTQAPRIFDIKNQPYDLTKGVYTGTEARLCVEIVPFDTAAVGAGVSLRLKDIQVVKVPARASSASASPFGAAEGAEDASPFDTATVVSSAGAGSDNGDF